MDTATLIERLHAAFHPPAAEEFDATVLLSLGDEAGATCLRLHVSHGSLDLAVAGETSDADFTLFFASAEQALALLTGRADPVAALMAHEFRADGYLILVFSVLALFRDGP